MSIGIIFDGKGVTQAQYDQVHKEIHPDNVLPKGMLYHAGGPVDGGWCVMEVWESQQAAQDYMKQTLGKALARARIDAKPRFFEVYNVMK